MKKLSNQSKTGVSIGEKVPIHFKAKEKFMPKYQMNLEVLSSHATQTWIVEANSPEEAIEKYNAGEGDIDFTEFEVLELAKPSIDDVEEVEE